MLKYSLNQIKNSKLHLKPFPYFVVKDLIPQKNLKKLNEILPTFREITEKKIYFQSSSGTKKTLLPNSERYKKLEKNKIFRNFNKLFKYLKPHIIKKFEKPIKENVKKKYHRSKFSQHSTFSVMKKGYLKSAHLDRRDHLVHVLYYSSSQGNKGGDIKILKLKKHKKIYDIFPSKNDLISHKRYKIKNNFCLFTLNVPWSYHSVTKYRGVKDRKYFYIVYDFPSNQGGAKLKNRKKGNNQNNFWNSKVQVSSTKRKSKFFSE